MSNKYPDLALARAKQAAAQLFDDVEEVAFLDELPTGERRYGVTRANRKDLITVTVNPNQVCASVEWKRVPRDRSSKYRVFKLQDLVVGSPDIP
jgi:phage terminase large subunit-like protein